MFLPQLMETLCLCVDGFFPVLPTSILHLWNLAILLDSFLNKHPWERVSRTLELFTSDNCGTNDSTRKHWEVLKKNWTKAIKIMLGIFYFPGEYYQQ